MEKITRIICSFISIYGTNNSGLMIRISIYHLPFTFIIKRVTELKKKLWQMHFMLVVKILVPLCLKSVFCGPIFVHFHYYHL